MWIISYSLWGKKKTLSTTLTYILFNATSISLRTSGSAFSLIVKLADVCWMNKLAMPILIPVISFWIALFTSEVIRWHPLLGAVILISCWAHIGMDEVGGAMLSLDDDDAEQRVVVLDPDCCWAKTKDVWRGDTGEKAKDTAGRNNKRSRWWDLARRRKKKCTMEVGGAMKAGWRIAYCVRSDSAYQDLQR